MKKWFTLIELIVVIAILAVLWVAAFLVLTDWVGKAWDSTRISDINTIDRALMTKLVEAGPGLKSSAFIWQQTQNIATWTVYYWEFNDAMITALELENRLTAAPKDPSTWNWYSIGSYSWSVMTNFSQYNIAATLEYNDQWISQENAYIRWNYRPWTLTDVPTLIWNEADNAWVTWTVVPYTLQQ